MKETLQSALSSWQTLNRRLPKLTEEQLQKLMQMEQRADGRLPFLLRIYGRYSVVRAWRERRELTR